ICVRSAPGTDFAEPILPSSMSRSPPHGERDSMHVLEAITAHFAYPLDVYMGAACLAVLGVCCAVVLFFVLGCLLLQVPGEREYRHRQVDEGTTACSARGC